MLLPIGKIRWFWDGVLFLPAPLHISNEIVGKFFFTLCTFSNCGCIDWFDSFDDSQVSWNTYILFCCGKSICYWYWKVKNEQQNKIFGCRKSFKILFRGHQCKAFGSKSCPFSFSSPPNIICYLKLSYVLFYRMALALVQIC